MTEEDIGKLKQAIASFGHWYDKIGRVSIIKNEEKVLILEKSIEYIEELENEIIQLKDLLVELYDCIPASMADSCRETLQKVALVFKED